MIASVSLLAQPKPTYLTRAKIGTMDCSVQQNTWANHGSSDLLVCITFQNEGYQSDTRTISFDLQNDTTGITELINGLQKSIIELGQNTDFIWDNDAFSIKTFDVANRIYLYESPKNGDGHTELSKVEAQHLIVWLTGTIRNRSKYIRTQQGSKKVLSSI